MQFRSQSLLKAEYCCCCHCGCDCHCCKTGRQPTQEIVTYTFRDSLPLMWQFVCHMSGNAFANLKSYKCSIMRRSTIVLHITCLELANVSSYVLQSEKLLLASSISTSFGLLLCYSFKVLWRNIAKPIDGRATGRNCAWIIITVPKKSTVMTPFYFEIHLQSERATLRRPTLNNETTI